MSFAEVVGYGMMYIVVFYIIGMILAMFLSKKYEGRGLDGLPMMFGPVFVLWIVAAVVGLVLLGRMTA